MSGTGSSFSSNLADYLGKLRVFNALHGMLSLPLGCGRHWLREGNAQVELRTRRLGSNFCVLTTVRHLRRSYLLHVQESGKFNLANVPAATQ